eukprot:jgi/Mesvir1/26787/Mv25908-RA.1
MPTPRIKKSTFHTITGRDSCTDNLSTQRAPYWSK